MKGRGLTALTLAAFIATGLVCAQNIRNIQGEKKHETRVEKQENKPASTRKTEIVDAPKVVIPDTVYSGTLVKQNGWYGPMRVLTKEEAQHFGNHYRLTGKNAKGLWTKVESLDGYGQYAENGMDTYIAKLESPVDTVINHEWKAKLNTGVIFEFIPDATGDNVIQERAYDKDYNLVYTFSAIPIGEGRYVGSYRDVYGLPAEMRPEAGYSYGTLVAITRDKWGNDIEVQYIDSKFAPKLNSDGAFSEHYDRDREGRLLRSASLDADGNRIIDNWGNCGVEYIWDTVHNRLQSSAYFDENGKPMILRAEAAGISQNTMMSAYDYDEYERCIRVRFLDAEGNPMPNASGATEMRREFDSYGNMTRRAGYTPDGNMAPLLYGVIAAETFEFDDKGRMVKYEAFDVDGNPLAEPGFYSSTTFEYDDTGRQIAYGYYQIIDSTQMATETLETTFSPDGSREERVTWDEDRYRLDRYDARGNWTLEGFYEKDGRLRPSSEGWSLFTVDFDYGDGKSRYVQRWYDEDGKLWKGAAYCNTSVVDVDSIGLWKRTADYMDGRLVSVYYNFYDKDFKNVIGGADSNRFGEISRVGASSNALRFYRGETQYTPFGEISTLSGVDEFGEPDYMVGENGHVMIYNRYTKNYRDPRLENDGVQRGGVNNEMIRNRLPKLMSIEVTDSIGYAYGLKGNDLVLTFGDYAARLDLPESESEFVGNWTVKTILGTDTPREMTVFRVEDGPAGKYGIKRIQLPAGTPSELGFMPHIRFMTEKQMERINRSIEEDGNVALRKAGDENRSTMAILVDFPDYFGLKRDNFYLREVKDASILLGAIDEDRGIKWKIDSISGKTVLNEHGIIGSMKHLQEFPRRHYFLTTDGKKAFETKIDDRTSDFNWTLFRISADDFAALRPLYAEAEKAVEKIEKAPGRFKKSEIVGYWRADETPGDDLAPTGYIWFGEDGSMEGDHSGYLTISDEDQVSLPGLHLIKEKRNWAGRWSTTGKEMLVLEPSEVYPLAFCVKVDADRTSLSPNDVANEINKYPGFYYNRMHYLSALPRLTMVRSVDKKHLVLSNGEGGEIRLVRLKGKPTQQQTVAEINASKEFAENPGGVWICDEGNTVTGFSLEQNNLLYVMGLSIVPRSETGGEFGLAAMRLGGGMWTLSDDGLKINFTSELNPGAITDVTNPESIEMVKRLEVVADSLNGVLETDLQPFTCGAQPYTMISSNEMEIAGKRFVRMQPSTDAVIGIIESPDLQLAKLGKEGAVAVLEWCDWTLEQTIEEFQQEFLKMKNEPKHLMLLPYVVLDNGDIDFGVPYEIDLTDEPLGLRIMDTQLTQFYHYTTLRARQRMMK